MPEDDVSRNCVNAVNSATWLTLAHVLLNLLPTFARVKNRGSTCEKPGISSGILVRPKGVSRSRRLVKCMLRRKARRVGLPTSWKLPALWPHAVRDDARSGPLQTGPVWHGRPTLRRWGQFGRANPPAPAELPPTEDRYSLRTSAGVA
jgi:hypothetical protein